MDTEELLEVVRRMVTPFVVGVMFMETFEESGWVGRNTDVMALFEMRMVLLCEDGLSRSSPSFTMFRLNLMTGDARVAPGARAYMDADSDSDPLGLQESLDLPARVPGGHAPTDVELEYRRLVSFIARLLRVVCDERNLWPLRMSRPERRRMKRKGLAVQRYAVNVPERL